MPPTVKDPPKGWTTDEDEMDKDRYWGPQGDGTYAATRVGLSSAEGIMIRSPEWGGDGYIFTTGGKYYLWNMLMGDVYEYTDPADLDGILKEMRKPGGQVEAKLLPVINE
ncbi:hypothetical protein DL767_000735 [Monosporascus sp. MG133]|nr:hypothetical protein DL767_000735 [Monosporascus sp. MG133]